MKLKREISEILYDIYRNTKFSTKVKDISKLQKDSLVFYKFKKDSSELEGVLSLDKKEIIRFNEAVSIFFERRKNFSSSISEAFIKDKFKEIIFSTKLINSRNKYNYIVKEVNSFFDSINKISIYYYFTRICNIKINKTVNIGGILFFPEFKELTKYIYKKYKIPIKELEKIAFPLRCAVEIKNGKKRVKKKELEDLTCWVGCKLSAKDPYKAMSIFMSKLNFLLNIFYFLTNEKNVWFYGEPFFGFWEGFYYNLNNKCSSLFLDNINISKKLNPFNLENIFKLPFFYKIDKICGEKDLNEIEKRIRNSIYWFGEAMKEKKREYILLKLIISLESLLLNKVDNKEKKLKRRIIPIVCKKNEEKKLGEKIIKEAYAHRCNIVHAGETTYIRSFLLKGLKELTKKSIIFLLSNNFQDITALDEYINNN